VEGWRAWIEVDLDALWANYLLLKARAQGEVIPVLKADAYGHGALPIARFLEERGVGRFAVAAIAEGRALREGGGEGGRCSFWGASHPLEAEAALRWGLTPTLSTLEGRPGPGREGPGPGPHPPGPTSRWTRG
jgi:alanine racemase